ncbi:hypothetical protein G7066_12065 [Leucobacter coleopterorum]|uniref:Carboxypeptidase regulatory-like domain-containing protein n=1 Tax=Leucobacter coleopterorum TaxID=2714933 RepID=A0ABX6K1J6_9MICO|nr:hypothetical protein [Leucobacter coleopterorum]QIM19117.1 hypothetical protein G7066_12065 [Leucobacter coleopterorum]
MNDMNGRTEPVNSDPTTVQVFRAVSSVELVSSAAELSGTVTRDLDFDGGFSAGDGSWPAGDDTVEIYSPAYDTVVATTDVDAAGNYRVLVPAGEYEVRLKASASADWSRLLPATSVTVAAGDVLTDQNVLYQEVIADPVLVDDPGMFAPLITVGVGKSVMVDVTANDTLDIPTAPGSIGMGAASNTVALPAATTAKGGSIAVTAPVIPGCRVPSRTLLPRHGLQVRPATATWTRSSTPGRTCWGSLRLRLSRSSWKRQSALVSPLIRTVIGSDPSRVRPWRSSRVSRSRVRIRNSRSRTCRKVLPGSRY